MSATNTLLPQHQALLDASAISPEVAHARGYRSVTEKRELAQIMPASQQLAPGLLIPLHNVYGEQPAYQLRPDEPRVVDGRKRKYETPRGLKMMLDCPPSTLQHIGNPKVTLWITEGVRKADALASVGLRAVALLGVNGWRGTNGDGGKLALEDFYGVALNGREIVLCFDSDAFQKPQVHAATETLGRWLETRGAQPGFVYLPHAADGSKQGVDDFLAEHTRDELLDLIETVWHPLPHQTVNSKPKVVPAQVDGAELLADLRAFIRRYVILPSDEVADLLALWVLHTWAFEAAFATPYLGSLRDTGQRQDAAAGAARRALPAGLARGQPVDSRAVPQDRPAAADTAARRDGQLPGRGPQGRALGAERRVQARSDGRPLQGHRRAGGVQVLLPEGVRRARPAFDRARAAVAQRHRPAGAQDGQRFGRDVDRSSVRGRGGAAARAVRRLGVPQRRAADRRAAGAAALADEPKRRGLVGAAGDRRPGRRRLAGASPEGVQGARRRRRQARRGAGPGDAAVDVRDAFGDSPAIFTAALLEKLNGIEEHPWGGRRNGLGLDGRGLARMLRPFGIKPQTVRVDEEPAKGYYLDQFADAFARHAPPPKQASQAQIRHIPTDGVRSVTRSVTPASHRGL